MIKLDDMLGDGMGDEPDGARIKPEYRAVCKALGYVTPTKPRRNNAAVTNASVAKYVETARCECGGTLIQTRSGSQAGGVHCLQEDVLAKAAKKKA